MNKQVEMVCRKGKMGKRYLDYKYYTKMSGFENTCVCAKCLSTSLFVSWVYNHLDYFVSQ